MTLRQRIKYLCDGLTENAPGLSLPDLRERLPEVRSSTLKRTVREMIAQNQLVARCDERHVYRLRTGTASVRIILSKEEREAAHSHGNQIVLDAIQRGHALVSEIMAATGLDERTVRFHVRRLMQLYRVRREYTPDDRHLARYMATRRPFLLAQAWTGVRPAEVRA